jgi:hypothetical protein
VTKSPVRHKLYRVLLTKLRKLVSAGRGWRSSHRGADVRNEKNEMYGVQFKIDEKKTVL